MRSGDLCNLQIILHNLPQIESDPDYMHVCTQSMQPRICSDVMHVSAAFPVLAGKACLILWITAQGQMSKVTDQPIGVILLREPREPMTLCNNGV